MDESNYSNCVWTNRTRKTDRAHNTDMLQRIYVPYQAYVGMILVCMDLCCHVVLKNKKNGLHEPQYNMLCTFYEDDYVSVQFNCFLRPMFTLFWVQFHGYNWSSFISRPKWMTWVWGWRSFTNYHTSIYCDNLPVWITRLKVPPTFCVNQNHNGDQYFCCMKFTVTLMHSPCITICYSCWKYNWRQTFIQCIHA